jgi:hypothetical protein
LLLLLLLMLEERHTMQTLKWKKNPYNPRAIEARVPRELGGGRYSIGDDGRPHGFIAYFDGQTIGEAKTREEAVALAERIYQQQLAARDPGQT